MSLPAISVIVPLYNKEKEVLRSVHSVLAQTFQNFELIIINDGSTDGSVEVVENIEDVRLRIIHQANSGVSAARNRGIAEAKADLIAFLDADDEWLPDFLETVVVLRSNYTSCDVFATRYFFSSLNGQKKLATIRGMPVDMQTGLIKNYFIIAAQSDPPLWTSAVAVSKMAIESIGGFPVGIVSGEDLLTWARLAVKYQIAYSTNPCAIHYNPQSISDRPERVPQEPDIVGDSLKDILDIAEPLSIPGLKAYIALWHRMRAVILIQLADMKRARKEVAKAMKLAPSLRLALILLIATLPGSLADRTLFTIKRMRASF